MLCTVLLLTSLTVVAPSWITQNEAYCTERPNQEGIECETQNAVWTETHFAGCGSGLLRAMQIICQQCHKPATERQVENSGDVAAKCCSSDPRNDGTGCTMETAIKFCCDDVQQQFAQLPKPTVAITTPKTISHVLDDVDEADRICGKYDACGIVQVEPHVHPMDILDVGHDCSEEYTFWCRRFDIITNRIQFSLTESNADLVHKTLCQCPDRQACPNDMNLKTGNGTVRIDSYHSIKLCPNPAHQRRHCIISHHPTALLDEKIEYPDHRILGITKVEYYCQCPANRPIRSFKPKSHSFAFDVTPTSFKWKAPYRCAFP